MNHGGIGGLVALCLIFGAAAPARAAVATLIPDADSAINDKYPDNNAGGSLTFDAGASGQGDRKRGLLRFDIAGQIPSGATISSVSLTVTVVQVPSGGGVDSIFSLHRLKQSWGEGSKVARDFGEPATTNEVTWNARFYPSVLWSTPGTAPPTDYVAGSSATNFIADPGNYTFNSNSNLVADVQIWLDNPGTNFGWLLKSLSEDISQSVRRFGSRESGTNPVLTVQYTVPANRPVLVPLAAVTNQFQFTFNAESNRAYAVEFRGGVDGTNWGVLTNIPPPGVNANILVRDPLTASNRFYRVRTP